MPVKTLRLGGREVSRVGLGTNRLTETAQNNEFIQAAVDAGVGLIDTAHLYTDGSSEATIGQALDADVVSAMVATKGGFGPGEGKPATLRAQIDESLRRLKTERIFLYYLHRVDPETPLEESLGVLADYQERGIIKHVGLSEVGIAEIELGRTIMPIAFVQNEFHLAQRGWDEVVDYCTREGIVFVPFRPMHGESPALQRVAHAHDATPKQIALAWLLHRSPMILPIPGTLSIEHVRENIAALEIELSDDEFEMLAELAP